MTNGQLIDVLVSRGVGGRLRTGPSHVRSPLMLKQAYSNGAEAAFTKFAVSADWLRKMTVSARNGAASPARVSRFVRNMGNTQQKSINAALDHTGPWPWNENASLASRLTSPTRSESNMQELGKMMWRPQAPAPTDEALSLLGATRGVRGFNTP